MTLKIRAARRQRCVLTITAALLATSAAAPVLAAAPQGGQAATHATVMSSAYYTFYSDASKTVIVGYGYRYCDGTYEQISGEWTRYYDVRLFPC
jgi:hypothetical protein